MKLRVGTRRSPLALAQAGQGMRSVVDKAGGGEWELIEMVTTGDRVQDRPLRDVGGKALFVRELDDALLRGDVDCAIHSLKDVPSDLPAGIVIAAVLERADVRDLLISKRGLAPAELAPGALVGTTSLRRASQLLAVNPQVKVETIRGNVATRLGRLMDGDFDATFLAAAGIARLGADLGAAKALALDPWEFIPAPGQGALAITAREDDRKCRDYLAMAEDGAARAAVEAERALARVFGGGCHLPIGVYAEAGPGSLRMIAVVVSSDGRRLLRDEASGEASHAAAVGEALGRRMLENGGAEIVAEAEAAAAGGLV